MMDINNNVNLNFHAKLSMPNAKTIDKAKLYKAAKIFEEKTKHFKNDNLK